MGRRALVLVVALLLTAGAAAAQDNRSGFWESWDTRIYDMDLDANQFRVSEVQTLNFSGTFRSGTRTIPLRNLSAIDDIVVYEGDEALEVGCAEQTGTFCVTETDETVTIKHYFIEPVTDDVVTFRVEYTVSGALRSYEGGDQFWWTAIPADHPFAINSATVTVELPEGYAPRTGVDPIATYGTTSSINVEESTVTATALNQIFVNRQLELRVQYPHNPAMQPPEWQAEFDANVAKNEATMRRLEAERLAREERNRQINAIGMIAAIVVGLAGAIGGPLFWYSRWYKLGKREKIVPPPEFLTDPPNDLPPGMAGALLDKVAQFRHVMATIIDLSRRGYITINAATANTIFNRTDKADSDLREYERDLLRRMFPAETGSTRDLNSLRHKFYDDAWRIQKQIKETLYAEGLLDTTREDFHLQLYQRGRRLNFFTIASLIFVVFAFFNANRFPPFVPVAAIALFVVILINRLALGLAFNATSTLPQKGEQQAALWNAFLTYLSNLKLYTQKFDLKPEQFEPNLPYAIAFGTDRSWIAAFADLSGTPAPGWYQTSVPVVVVDTSPDLPDVDVDIDFDDDDRERRGAGIPAVIGGPSNPVSANQSQEAQPDVGRTLDSLSASAALSLDSISQGFSSMLNTAANALGAKPPSTPSPASSDYRSYTQEAIPDAEPERRFTWTTSNDNSSSSWDSGGSSWSGGGGGSDSSSDSGSSGGGSSDFD